VNNDEGCNAFHGLVVRQWLNGRASDWLKACLKKQKQASRHRAYNVTLRRVGGTIVVVEKQ